MHIFSLLRDICFNGITMDFSFKMSELQQFENFEIPVFFDSPCSSYILDSPAESSTIILSPSLQKPGSLLWMSKMLQSKLIALQVWPIWQVTVQFILLEYLSSNVLNHQNNYTLLYLTPTYTAAPPGLVLQVLDSPSSSVITLLLVSSGQVKSNRSSRVRHSMHIIK